MDVPFLKNTVGAYITKHRLSEQLNADDIFTEIYEIIRLIRESDIELYDKLYDTGRMTQVAIIDSYLDMAYREQETEALEESILTGVSAGILAILTYIYGEKITRTIYNSANKIAKGFERVGKFIASRGRYWKFSYAIIRENSNKCYKKCGVDEKNLHPLSYAGTRDEPRGIGSAKSMQQGNCLANCYVGQMIDVIALTTKSYFVCLKKTGDYSVVEKLRPDDTIKVISGLKLSSACNEYHKEMKDLFDDFNDLLDHVYRKDQGKKQKALSLLREKLLESKKQVTFTRDHRKFN